MTKLDYAASNNLILHQAARTRVADLTNQLFGVTGGRVQSGPFAEMNLPADASWGGGDLCSKLLGCYEAELHPSIERAIERAPNVVINVGCAEGFYAIGLARRLPNARVYAFDSSAAAQAVCASAAAQNYVSDRVIVGGTCDANQLTAIAQTADRALIFLDCEGAEMQLLPEEAAPRLRHCDVLVECHDFVNREITPALQRRFLDSHDVVNIREGARDPSAYPMLRTINSLDRWLLVCEFRPELMNWLACWAR